MSDPRNKSLDPRNPAHRHGLGLPPAYYANTRPARAPSDKEAARVQAYREEFARRKAAGTLPKISGGS